MSHGETHPHPEVLYYHIVKDSIELAKIEKDNFKRIQAITTSLVFSALCLEAFINQEYSKAFTGKDLKKKESWSIKNKWLELPRSLGSPESFKTDDEPFTTFKDIIYTRNNRLVHFKPWDEKWSSGKSPKEKEYWGNLVGDIRCAERYLKCVEEMIQELNRLTHGKTTDKDSFLREGRYVSRVWSSSGVHIESLSGVKSKP